MENLVRKALQRFMLAACCLLVISADAQTITIAGSETVRPVAERWSMMFQRREPTINICVLGGGSSVGFSSLQTGKAEIAQSSRRINPNEKQSIEASGQRVRETTVATDAVVFYVHPSNP